MNAESQVLAGESVSAKRRFVDRSSWQKLSFLALVIFPTFLFAFYLAIVAAPRYQAEFRIQIKAPGQSSGLSMGQLIGVAGIPSAATDNGYAVIQFLESSNAVVDLDKAIALRRRYSRPSIDYFSRLPEDAPIETFQRYWKSRLSAEFEQTSSTVRVKITAFSPQDAYSIAIQSLRLSEELLNNMTTRSRRDAVRYAESEVRDAEERLRGIERKMFAARSRERVIDPAKQVTAAISRISDLQKQVDVTEADVVVRRRYLSPDAPGRVLAELRLAQARARAEAARDELANSRQQPERTLASAVSTFDALDVEKNFAERRLQNALGSLSSTESEAVRQQLYLDTVVRPTVPQEPTFPKPIQNIALFLFFAVAGWVVFVLVVAGVRDHVRV